MPAADFKTISVDLLHVAADVETYFSDHGYLVEIEARALGFSFAPAMVARRGHETIIVEVMEGLDRKRIERWVRYCKSQSTDTRFGVVVRRAEAVPAEEISYAHKEHVGLFVHDDNALMELRAPSDLAVNVVLPEITDLPKRIRPYIAGAFKKFEGDWRDGLGDSYDEIEQLARDHLKQGIASGRIVIDKFGKGGVLVGQFTQGDVDGKTLGTVKKLFTGIKSKNYADSVILETLELILNTRNGLTHTKKSAKVEEELRRKAGGHLYVVINCLEVLIP